MPDSDKIGMQKEFEAFIEVARRISTDVGKEVELVLKEGRERPLSRSEARAMLLKVITTLRDNGKKRGDVMLASTLEGDISTFVEQLVEVGGERADAPAAPNRVDLVTFKGVKPIPISPRPFFHGREVAMTGGYVKVSDIVLWDRNERLEIHLGQFAQ